MRKAITPVISIIILLLITISLAGMGWTYMSGYYEAMTSKQIKIVEGSLINNEFMLMNIGTGEIARSEIKVLVDGEEAEILNMTPSVIEPRKSSRIIFRSPSFGESVSVRVLAPGNAVSYTERLENQIYILDEYENFNVGSTTQSCSDGLYVMENSRIKFFTPVPNTYWISTNGDCTSRTTDADSYGASPMRIWAKGTDADAYRRNNNVIDQTSFGYHFPDQPTVSDDMSSLTYRGSISSDLEPEITYTLPPDKNYVRVEIKVKNVGTAAAPVTLRWSGDQDSAGFKHFQSGYESSGYGPHQVDAGERWLAEWTGSRTDVMGFLVPENAEVEIYGTYEPVRVEETAPTTLSPGQSHTFTFYIMAAPKGTPEYQPVEDAFDELF